MMRVVSLPGRPVLGLVVGACLVVAGSAATTMFATSIDGIDGLLPVIFVALQSLILGIR